MNRLKKFSLVLTGMLFCFAICANTAVAQQITATISGTVSDPAGAVIPGATVTATSVETGLSKSSTTGADGAPHVIPIWGSWVGDRWYVEGGPTRWQRNLRENPQAAIHIEIGDEVVIVEGTAIEHVAPPQPLADAILAGYAKYKVAEDYQATADHWTEGGLWELRPLKAFAWSTFPDDMTRFRFDAG